MVAPILFRIIRKKFFYFTLKLRLAATLAALSIYLKGMRPRDSPDPFFRIFQSDHFRCIKNTEHFSFIFKSLILISHYRSIFNCLFSSLNNSSSNIPWFLIFRSFKYPRLSWIREFLERILLSFPLIKARWNYPGRSEPINLHRSDYRAQYREMDYIRLKICRTSSSQVVYHVNV